MSDQRPCEGAPDGTPSRLQACLPLQAPRVSLGPRHFLITTPKRNAGKSCLLQLLVPFPPPSRVWAKAAWGLGLARPPLLGLRDAGAATFQLLGLVAGTLPQPRYGRPCKATPELCRNATLPDWADRPSYCPCTLPHSCAQLPGKAEALPAAGSRSLVWPPWTDFATMLPSRKTSVATLRGSGVENTLHLYSPCLCEEAYKAVCPESCNWVPLGWVSLQADARPRSAHSFGTP